MTPIFFLVNGLDSIDKSYEYHVQTRDTKYQIKKIKLEMEYNK